MNLDKLKRALVSNKVKVGTEITLKALKKGEAKEVFISNNCPEELLKQVKKYCEIIGAGVNQLDMNNEELGVVCKKPFSINICYSY